jgi:hypothetical protein
MDALFEIATVCVRNLMNFHIYMEIISSWSID